MPSANNGQQSLGMTPWGTTTLSGISPQGAQQADAYYQQAVGSINNLANKYLTPSQNQFNPTSFSAAQPNLINPTTSAYNSATAAQQAGLNSSQLTQGQNTNAQNQALTGLQSAYGNAMNQFNQATYNPQGSIASQYNTALGNLNSNLNPYIQSGTQATGQLNNLLGSNGSSFQNTAIQSVLNSPAFQAQLGQGANLVNNQQAVMGQLNSGAGAQALQNYGSQQGSAYVQQQIANLQNQAATGQSAASSLGSLYNSGLGAENAAQLALGNSQFNNTMSGQQAIAGQYNTGVANNLAGQQLTNAQSNALASTYGQSAAAQQAALQGQFGNANTAYQNNYTGQLASYNANQAAQQNYVNLLANSSLTGATANAQAAYLENPQYTTISQFGGIQF